MPCRGVAAGFQLLTFVRCDAADEDLAVRIHTAMVRLQTLDTVFYDAQRQVRKFWSLQQ